MSLRHALPLLTVGALAACVSSDPISSGGAGGGDDGTEVDDTGGAGGYYVPEGGAYGEGGSTESGAFCGDKVCAIGETCDNCPEDCPCSGPVCGDGTCDAATETCESCEADCGACPMCGDGECTADEDCDSCYMDCGVCECEADGFEPNQNSPVATAVQKATDYCDLSICSGDVDWFKFSVNGTTTIKLTFLNAEGDLDLEIYNPNYVTGSYSADDDEQVTLTGVASGTYYARVYGDMMVAENPDYCIRVD
ncbi:MAG: hypothetical protein HOW73_07880 [Polyangiaceae bacterium]|nr:hypothetical protein [Polyangiaceae bacterium]